jgi:hypothetical protein
VEQAELAKLFGVSARRISQIELRAIAKLKEAKSDSPDFPHGEPHFVTPRWNSLLINWSVLCSDPGFKRAELCLKDYPSYPVQLKRAPRPYLDSGDALACLSELIRELLETPLLRPWFKPRIISDQPLVSQLGWEWIKPTIIDEGWKHGAADVWNPVPDSARIDPKWAPWPYPRPTLWYKDQQWFAYTQLDSSMLRAALPGATSGDLARITKMRLKEWDRKPPGKPATPWASVYTFGNHAWGGRLLKPSLYYSPEVGQPYRVLSVIGAPTKLPNIPVLWKRNTHWPQVRCDDGLTVLFSRACHPGATSYSNGINVPQTTFYGAFPSPKSNFAFVGPIGGPYRCLGSSDDIYGDDGEEEDREGDATTEMNVEKRWILAEEDEELIDG